MKYPLTKLIIIINANDLIYRYENVPFLHVRKFHLFLRKSRKITSLLDVMDNFYLCITFSQLCNAFTIKYDNMVYPTEASFAFLWGKYVFYVCFQWESKKSKWDFYPVSHIIIIFSLFCLTQCNHKHWGVNNSIFSFLKYLMSNIFFR